MDETVRMTSTPAGSAPGSPRSKVKFLCSQGGKILLRPGDGLLKYVGGETRVISVPRNIDFSGLTKKIATLNEGDVILKYQLIHEDLDALVTVRSDEDLRHMLDEYDRYELSGAPRLRAFLFPSYPAITETPASLIDTHSLEQHYIDAINGVFRIGPKYSILGGGGGGRGGGGRYRSRSRSHSVPISSSESSSSSSPKSVVSVENVGPDAAAVRLQNYIKSRVFLQRVQSSPNLANHYNYNNNNNHHHHHHRSSGHQSPQNLSGYQTPVIFQYDRQGQVQVQMQMQAVPARRVVVDQSRKAGYPPPIRHVRSVSGFLHNEEYVVDRRVDMEDWVSRMR